MVGAGKVSSATPPPARVVEVYDPFEGFNQTLARAAASLIDTPLAINRRRVEQLARVAHDRYHPGVILGASVLTIYDLFASIPRNIVSLPGRAWDARSRLFRDAGPQDTPQEVSYVRGEAAAEVLLLGTEVGSYVFMGRGFFQPGQGLVEGANITINPSRGTAALFATRQRAFSFAPATVVVSGGAATLTSSSFGGPMATPEAVRMSTSGPKQSLLVSAERLQEIIQDEIGNLEKAGPEWQDVLTRAQDLFSKTLSHLKSAGGQLRSKDPLQSLANTLRARQEGLTPENIQSLLDAYEETLRQDGKFSTISQRRKGMLQEARQRARAARPPKPPKPIRDPHGELVMMDVIAGSPPHIASLVRAYNEIMAAFQNGDHSFSQVSRLVSVVTDLEKYAAELPPGNNVAEALQAFKQMERSKAWTHFHRACTQHRTGVQNIAAIIGRTFVNRVQARVGLPPRHPTLDELDAFTGDPSSVLGKKR